MGIEKAKIAFIVFVLFVAAGLALVSSQERQPLVAQKQPSSGGLFHIFPIALVRSTPQPLESAIPSQTPEEVFIPGHTAQPDITPTPDALTPRISSITPRRGGAGTAVTITGSGFLPTGNVVVTMMEEFDDVPSTNGTTLRVIFKGPPFVHGADPAVLNFYNQLQAEMEYQVGVRNKNGRSNFVPFIFQFYE